jgi:hypothetical protein
VTDRYAGKPFLKLLDSYVLSAIGELGVDAERQLTSIEPRLREVYAAEGDWRSIVAGQMGFPDTLPARILEVWQAGRARFVEQAGVQPDPLEFTRTFVDTNFPN